MSESRVVALRQEDEIDDPLTEILRAGAKRLIKQAVEAEFAAFLSSHGDLKLPDGRQRVVRHGHDPVRPIQTGIGPVEVEKPKARDRGALSAEERIRYSSSILPKWARRTKSLDVLFPALYLRGISTGDFQEVLTALLGKDAPNLSPSPWDLKPVLGEIKPDGGNMHGGRLLSSWRFPTTTLWHIDAGERGPSIPSRISFQIQGIEKRGIFRAKVR